MLLDIKNNTWSEQWGESVQIKMNSDVTLAIGNKDNSITLFDMFDPGLGVRRKLIKNGYWNLKQRNSNCSFISTVSVYERRKDMSGVYVRVAFLVTKNITVPLKQYLKDMHNNVNVDSIGKFNYELFENIIEEFNFTYACSFFK